MSQKVTEESLPATAPSAHSGFNRGSLGLCAIVIIIETSVCEGKPQSQQYFTSRGDGAMG